MRHGVESQGLFEQLSIKLQELARVCRACIRHDKADIQILRMLGEPQDEALFREVHREGAELNTEVSCDIASDLIKECHSPGHQHEIDPGSRDLSCEFDAYSGRGTGNERPRPELLFVKQRFHVSSPFVHLNSSTAPQPVAPSFPSHNVLIQFLRRRTSISTRSGSFVPCATAAIPGKEEKRCIASSRESLSWRAARNCFSSQPMGSVKSAVDFFARAPPSLCNSEHRLPSGHPPRASRSRFAWMLLTKANSRSFGALKRFHSARAARNSSSSRSTTASPSSSLVLK